MNVLCLKPSSIYINWEDKRYIQGNEHRNITCESGHVDLQGPFWLPTLDVMDTMESVILIVFSQSQKILGFIFRQDIWPIK